jgi:DNA-binding XRE family transcriptional regulator
VDSPPWTGNLQALSAFLTDYRGRLRLTQQALGKQIGASVETIKNWESGRTLPQKQFWVAMRSIIGAA